MNKSTRPVFGTIGTFDGVHLGHKSVVSRLKELAALRGRRPVVFVFSNHPLEIINPAKMPRQLMSYEEKAEALRRLGVDVEPIHFTEKLRTLTSAQYMLLLRDHHNVKGLLLGYDNGFGSDRQSGIEQYIESGRCLGIEVERAPELPGVSSSIVRNLLHDGLISHAASLLGRPYSITGRIVSGQQIGRTIGFPTANVAPLYKYKLIPAHGVYAALATINGDASPLPAVVNIGVRPTVAEPDAEPTIEAHILGFQGDIYNRNLRLDFVDRIRDERKFDSLEELTSQIRRDSDKAKEILSHLNPLTPQSENVIP